VWSIKPRLSYLTTHLLDERLQPMTHTIESRRRRGEAFAVGGVEDEVQVVPVRVTATQRAWRTRPPLVWR
jgi:hypothetical protein